MDDIICRMKKNKEDEKIQTLNYIFNIDQKEVFDNELDSLKEDIESNNLDRLKIPAIFNFISYKTNQIKFQAKLAKNLKGRCNDSGLGKFLVKENYKITREHIDNYVRKGNLTNFNDTEKKNNSEDYIATDSNLKCGDKLDNFLNFYENKKDIGVKNKDKFRKRSSNSNLEYNKRCANNFESKSRDFSDKINIGKIIGVHQTLGNNVEERQIENQKIKVVYELKILYLDGSENSAQLCRLEIDENSDYNIFVQKLKKQLGIYEYSKFKILLLNQSSNLRRVYLEEISQLNKDGFNEIKIIPV